MAGSLCGGPKPTLWGCQMKDPCTGWSLDKPASGVPSKVQVLCISSQSSFLSSNLLVLLFCSGPFSSVFSSQQCTL